MRAGAIDCNKRLISGWMTGIAFLHTDHAVLKDSVPRRKWMLFNFTASGRAAFSFGVSVFSTAVLNKSHSEPPPSAVLPLSLATALTVRASPTLRSGRTEPPWSYPYRQMMTWGSGNLFSGRLQGTARKARDRRSRLFPGPVPTADVYAYVKTNAKQNLYQLQLPRRKSTPAVCFE